MKWLCPKLFKKSLLIHDLVNSICAKHYTNFWKRWMSSWPQRIHTLVGDKTVLFFLLREKVRIPVRGDKMFNMSQLHLSQDSECRPPWLTTPERKLHGLLFPENYFVITIHRQGMDHGGEPRTLVTKLISPKYGHGCLFFSLEWTLMIFFWCFLGT